MKKPDKARGHGVTFEEIKADAMRTDPTWCHFALKMAVEKLNCIAQEAQVCGQTNILRIVEREEWK